MIRTVSCAIALAIAGCAPQARASTILFSNVTSSFPGDSISGTSTLVPFIGAPFTTTAGGQLLSISIGIYSDTADVSITAGLYADSGDEPGTLLESYNINVPQNGGSSATTMTSVTNPTLSADNQYWLVFSGAQIESPVFLGNDENILGGPWAGNTLTGMTPGNPSTDALGIQVLGASATPEPMSWLFVAAGCLTLVGFRRVRQVF